MIFEPILENFESPIDLGRIEIYDMIYEAEHEEGDEGDQEHTDGEYLLGLCWYDRDYHYNLLSASVCPRTYFSYPFDAVVDYLNNYSILYQDRVAFPDILQLSIVENMYKVTIKTFWLRIIQRTWKRIFHERKDIKRRMLPYLRKRELGIQRKQMPTLRGMMSYLKNI